MYGPSQLGWNFPSAGLDVFSKTLLRTNSSASHAGYANWLTSAGMNEAMRMAVASRSSSTVSRSLIMDSVLVSSGIPV